MNKRAVGTEYESFAAEYLEKQGYRMIRRNYRCRMGEIDLIAWHQGYLVFIEVKYRKNSQSGTASEAVDVRKQQRIIRVARWYLMESRFPESQPVRFDVVAIDGEDAQIIRDAFWMR
ncbi:MAG: YraN family protein [Lachnospiraceae bacterium]|nr:YraN family protein [Lachnospiraceae bacterium]